MKFALSFEIQKALFRLVSLVCLSFFVGCGVEHTEDAYGESEGARARSSTDGFSAFRNYCDDHGRKTSKIGALSTSVADKINTIVWIQAEFFDHSPDVCNWIENWLSKGGKQLIYVGRDHSSFAEYMKISGDRYIDEKNLSSAIKCFDAFETEETRIANMRTKCNDPQFNRWFLSDHHLHQRRRVEQIEGELADTIGDTPYFLTLRSYLMPLDQVDLPQQKKEFEALVSNNATATKGFPAPTFQRSRSSRFRWNYSDASNLPQYISEIDGVINATYPEYESQILLETKDGFPLISSLSTPDQPASNIVLLSNSSPISNLSMTFEGNRRIAKELITKMPPGRVGFLLSEFDPEIREEDSEVSQQGFAMLTQWPLNLITIHFGFLGMLILVTLFPIFGRPKTLPAPTLQDFSLHIQALGSLLYKSGDRFYALATIADYFRNVRKDTNSPWASAEGAGQESQSPFQKQPPQSTNSTPSS